MQRTARSSTRIYVGFDMKAFDVDTEVVDPNYPHQITFQSPLAFARFVFDRLFVPRSGSVAA